jgi:lipopolysaccharide transport system ATP-binding protein
MRDVSGEGRTVLFVSHNLVAVNSICQNGILLENGSIKFSGKVGETVENYIKVNANKLKPKVHFNNFIDAFGSDIFKIKTVEVKPYQPFVTDEISIDFSFWNLSNDNEIYLAFDIINQHEEVIFGSGIHLKNDTENICSASCFIPANLMNDGIYTIKVYVNTSEMSPIIQFDNVITFEIIDKYRNYAYFGKINGAVRPNLKWIT